MNALFLSLVLAPPMVSLDAQEITVRDLSRLTGTSVEYAPEVADRALFVRVKEASSKQFLEWVATAMDAKLTPTPTGFALNAPPVKPRDNEWADWRKRVSTAIGTRSLEQVRARAVALETQRQKLTTNMPSGWQDAANKLGNELGPLNELVQNPLVYPILRLGLATPVGETQVLRLPEAIRLELEGELSPSEAVASMVLAYRLEPSGLKLALASVPRQGATLVFEGRVALESPPPLSTVAGPIDDPLAETKAKIRRFGADGTAWLEQLPGNLVVWTAREHVSRSEPARSALELRSKLTSAGFELKFADGVWTGRSADAAHRTLPMERIRKIESKGGFASLDEFAELAAGLPPFDPDAVSVDFDLVSLAKAKPALTAYASLTPDRRERLRERIPLAVDELNPTARQAFWNALRRDADPVALARMAVTLDPARDLGEAGLSFHLSHFVSPVNVDFSSGGAKFLEQANLNTKPARLRRCEFRFGYSVEDSMLYTLDILEPAG